MSALYPDGPAVTLSLDRGDLHYAITLTPATLGWVSSRNDWYTLMIDSAAYPLVPLSARTDDPAAWAWAIEEGDRVIGVLVQLKADARRVHPARFGLVFVAPDVAFDAIGADAPLRVEAGAGGLRVNGARVLVVERVGEFALVMVESDDDDDPPRPNAYLLRVDSLPPTPPPPHARVAACLRDRFGERLIVRDVAAAGVVTKSAVHLAIRRGRLQGAKQDKVWTFTPEQAAAWLVGRG